MMNEGHLSLTVQHITI